jgi:predicted acylesterase/phospholipase RssA
MKHHLTLHSLFLPSLAAVLLAACTAKYPGEKLVANAWVMRGLPAASEKSGSVISNAETLAVQQEFVVAPMTLKEFPEYEIDALKGKADLGLAFSGGGNRAAVCALGQIRALTEMGVMKKARYVSSVSGGSWFCVPYTFARGDEDAFLGPFVPPSQLTLSTLAAAPTKNSFARCATHARTPLIPSMLSGHGDENFAHRLNQIYLSSFGTLGDEHRFFCYNEKARDAILKRNPNLGANDFNLAAPGRPYLIANTVMAARGPTRTERFVPVEVTPNYTGAAASRNLSLVSNFPIGGGYVESFAYDSRLNCRQQTGDTVLSSVSLPVRHGFAYRSSPRFTPSDVMAASGAAPSVLAPNTISSLVGFPEFLHWSPAATNLPQTKELAHTDGGAIDNSGIIPLLRRKVGTIIAFVNTEMEFEQNEQNKSPKFPDYIAALFGFTTEQSKLVSKDCKVFQESEYKDLQCHFLKAWTKNAPLIIHRKKTYRTEENKRYGISGGHQVRVIWVFLGGHKDMSTNDLEPPVEYAPRAGSLQKWINNLPPETAPLFKGQSKKFKNFPYYRTFLQNGLCFINLSASQVNALTQYTSYALKENPHVFKQWSN